MSATASEPTQPDGCGTTLNLGLAGKNSRKLFGYDFVKYRPDCESSNANGLLKFNDVVNFGRRICERDPNAHNCVMCGEFDVVIPTQNKDVCKACDSSFWYNAMLNVAFKFCKGCKNFVTLEMFSDKPDASKCDRCRRRGRENYLTKKYIGVQDTCSTPGLSTGSPPSVSPVLSTDAQEQAFAGFKYSFDASSSPSVCTPASVLCSFHKVPYTEDRADQPSLTSEQSTLNFAPTPQTATRPSNKRSISADVLLTNPAEVVVAFYASIPAKPPKTPRSVSYSSDPPRPMVTPRSDLQPLPRTLNILNTPRGRRTATVTPASYVSQEVSSNGGASSSSGGSGSSRSVRFARSDSMGSADGVESEETTESQSQYLWDRNCYDKGSPQAMANASTPQHGYVPATSSSSVLPRHAPLGAPAGKVSAPTSVTSSAMMNGKENSCNPSLDAFSLLHSSCARLFSDAMHRESSYMDYRSARGRQEEEYTRRSQPHGQHHQEVDQNVEKERQTKPEGRDVCIVSPSTSEGTPDEQKSPVLGSADLLESAPGSHCKDLRRLGSLDASCAPNMMAASPDLLYLHAANTSSTASVKSHSAYSDVSLCNNGVQANNACTDEGKIEGRTNVSEKRQWEWDPSLNPLMHLAMITERI